MKINGCFLTYSPILREHSISTECKKPETALKRFSAVFAELLSTYGEKINSTAFVSALFSSSDFAYRLDNSFRKHYQTPSFTLAYGYSFWISFDLTFHKDVYIMSFIIHEDTNDTTEDTEDTNDTTEDTEDTNDTTEDTEDTNDTTEDTNKFTVVLGSLDDISVSCLSFQWCHAPFDTVKACYNCAFNQSCDTAVKYSFTTDNFQILPAWVYSQYNINPVLTVALTHFYNAFIGKFGEKITPYSAFSADTDKVIIIDDTFLSEEMPF